MKITNEQGISLPMAVWLLDDNYDYNDDPNYISVTSLMKPIKSTILAARIPSEKRVLDLADLIPSALGSAVHTAIEHAWNNKLASKLKRLGYSDAVVERVQVNPESVEPGKSIIPVYMEQRAIKQVGKWKVGGKFDLIADGIIQDFKSTSAYSWVYGGRMDDYQRQLSLYRWLNPEKVTEDYGIINYIFTDWQKATAKQNPKYPQKRIEEQRIPLLDPEECQQWVEHRLRLLEQFWDAPEKEMPRCTDEELWRSEPAYKYYKDASKTDGRSTKNFTSLTEANKHMATIGKGLGIVKTIPGEVKRCKYCMAFPICEQRKRMLPDE